MMKPRDLEKEYEAAIYRVDRPSSPITFAINKANEDLDDFVRSHDGCQWAFMTACNPRSVVHSPEENVRLNNDLVSNLKIHGYKYFPGSGGSDLGSWPSEKSFLVIDIPQENAVLLAKKFDQNAIVWSKVGDPPKLIWCTSEY